MEIPQVSRPYMPGYGIAGPGEGSGLLHWSWAAERLTAARNYWVTSVWPDGRPHVMPVWGMWDDSTLWFTSSAGSRKVRNLAADPRCCVTTEDASDPVIIEGTAHISTELAVLRRVIDLMNAKYRTDFGVDFLDPRGTRPSGSGRDGCSACGPGTSPGHPRAGPSRNRRVFGKEGR